MKYLLPIKYKKNVLSLEIECKTIKGDHFFRITSSIGTQGFLDFKAWKTVFRVMRQLQKEVGK